MRFTAWMKRMRKRGLQENQHRCKMSSNKREQIDFKKGDKLFSPKYGYVTIEATRGYGMKKEFMIEVAGEKVWYSGQQLKG